MFFSPAVPRSFWLLRTAAVRLSPPRSGPGPQTWGGVAAEVRGGGGARKLGDPPFASSTVTPSLVSPPLRSEEPGSAAPAKGAGPRGSAGEAGALEARGGAGDPCGAPGGAS